MQRLTCSFTIQQLGFVGTCSMKTAAATVADRFHTDAEPDTLVFIYDSWKRRVSAVIVLSDRPFVLLR